MTCMQELIVREFSFHQLNANLLWPGTFSFAEWLVQHRSWMDGRRVLELGRYGLWDWTMWFFCISNIMVASHQLVGIFFHAFFLLLLLSAFMSIFLFLKILCKILPNIYVFSSTGVSTGNFNFAKLSLSRFNYSDIPLCQNDICK